MHMHELTAALLEDNCATELVEPLSVEARSVNRHGVLWENTGPNKERVKIIYINIFYPYYMP